MAKIGVSKYLVALGDRQVLVRDKEWTGRSTKRCARTTSAIKCFVVTTEARMLAVVLFGPNI